MSDSTRNLFATLGIIVASMIFFLLMAGLVFFANGTDGLRSLLTVTGYLVALIVIVALVASIQIIGAWIGNLNAKNYIAAQVSNDRSDVAKFGALKESLRGQNEYERDVRRHALPVARMLAKPAPVEDTPAVNNSWDIDDDDDVDVQYRVME